MLAILRTDKTVDQTTRSLRAFLTVGLAASGQEGRWPERPGAPDTRSSVRGATRGDRRVTPRLDMTESKCSNFQRKGKSVKTEAVLRGLQEREVGQADARTFPVPGCAALGLGSNDGDEEGCEVISAPALRHKLGHNLPPGRSLLFCATKVPFYLRRKHLSHAQAQDKAHWDGQGPKRGHLKEAGLSPRVTLATLGLGAWGPPTAQGLPLLVLPLPHL